MSRPKLAPAEANWTDGNKIFGENTFQVLQHATHKLKIFSTHFMLKIPSVLRSVLIFHNEENAFLL